MATESKPRLLARFADFRGGNFGLADPSRAPAGSWTGDNAMVYATGLLGPRPGLLAGPAKPANVVAAPLGLEYLENGRDLAPSWADGLWGVWMADSGSPRALTLRYSLDGGSAWVLAGTTGSVGTATAPGSGIPATFSHDSSNNDGNWITYANVEGALYRFDVRTPAVDPVQVTLPTPLVNIVRYKDHLVGVDRDVVANRIYYSELTTGGPDFESWPAGNNIQVGDSFPITALIPTLNGLLVGKATGWWLVTGALGATAATRPVAFGYGPANFASAKIRPDGSVAVLTPDGTPGIFTGVDTKLYEDHRFLEFDALPVGVITSASGRKTMFIGQGASPDGDPATVTTRVHVLDDATRAWSHFTFPAGIHAGAPVYLGASRIPDRERRVSFAATSGAIAHLVYDTSKAGPPSLHPAFVSAGGDGAGAGDLGGDPITATVWLPAAIDPQGRPMQVQSVRVAFHRWALQRATPPFTHNIVRVKVRALDNESGATVTPQREWRLQEPAATEHPVVEVRDFRLSPPLTGAGFQVGLELVGCAVREVSVYGTVRGERRVLA